MSLNNSIKKIISDIKSELNSQYQQTEIESFISLIFESIFSYTRIQIFLNEDQLIDDEKLQKIKDIIRRLKQWEPIQYILSKTEFYGLSFNVNQDVLIPRQETEELVEWVIQEHSGSSPKILDIGTGSGCIAISLAKNIKNSKVTAYDISQKAIDMAKTNASKNGVSVDFVLCDVLQENCSQTQTYDVIVSNPPYVTESEKKLMLYNVLDFEPHLALFVSDNNPLLFYKSIIVFAQNALKKGGKLYFEINENYGHELVSLFKENKFADIELKKDLNGKDRMIRGTYK